MVVANLLGVVANLLGVVADLLGVTADLLVVVTSWWWWTSWWWQTSGWWRTLLVMALVVVGWVWSVYKTGAVGSFQGSHKEEEHSLGMRSALVLPSTKVMAGRAPVRNRFVADFYPQTPDTIKLRFLPGCNIHLQAIEKELDRNRISQRRDHFTPINGKKMQLRCTLVTNHRLTAVHYIQCAALHCRMVPMPFLLNRYVIYPHKHLKSLHLNTL